MTTTETGPVAAPGSGGAPDGGRPTRSRHGVRALIVRLHFYAGVFVAPFLFVAALTGLLYAFTPQFDQLLYGDRLTVEQVGDAPRPLAEQIEAARAAHPEGTLASVITPPGPEDTTRVVLSLPELGENQRTVFVDPYTAEVQGELTTWWGATPLTAWLDEFHRSLHLGEFGTLYSELAASWLWVVAAGGLVLWAGRARGQRAASARGVLFPDRSAGGVRRTRSLHAATGVWLSLGLFFLSATGLTWSEYAGARFDQAVDAVRGQAPVLDTRLPGSAPADGGGEHAGHHAGGGGDTAGVAPEDFGTALRTARDAGLDETVVVTPPTGEGMAWTVTQSDNTWPVHYDGVAVDVMEAEVTDRTRWADHPLAAKLSKLGVQGHMGVLFGIVNQVVLAAIAVGLMCVMFWGYRMWWQRRPTRDGRRAAFGRPPARGTWRSLPWPVLLVGIPVVAVVGWALPLFGVTLLAFLVVDVVVGVLRGQRS
ncbi:PepSY domain-containing protein [Streptomyces sp. MJP52]|uniref:PepSY-associated TM helix domain-containing protein n=1 Tax=Streptomyces sp. MJP52 TaxID=2940555 RepID=UPI0024764C45|nr:PepSY domain-containing protein [Streptomyces sp. MJP52]MDH6229283.1 putative iron-regulated membrane protein [Streptomyces sp. MJP52]